MPNGKGEDERLHQDDHSETNGHTGHNGKEKRSKFWSLKSVRMQLGILLCLNFFVLAVMRNNLGVAMVCMVNRTAVEAQEVDKLNQTGNVSMSDVGHLEEKQIRRRAKSEGCPVPESYEDDYQVKGA